MRPADLALAASRGATAALAAARRRIDDLNVYPVPDGDTGSNLADTASALEAGVREAAEAGADVAELARAATRATLMGARGNSGVILSQIVRGFAEVLADAEALDGQALARALRGASDCAYRAVRQPVEGTMLTAIRRMAEGAEGALGADPGTAAGAVLDAALAAGERTVDETREMLPVLREAGVVDAGAAGLLEFVRGAAAGARGEELRAPQEAVVRPLDREAAHAGHSRYRYCTNLVVEGPDVDARRLERELERLGDSLLVVGAAPQFKVHIHTDEPGTVLTLAVAMGAIDRVEVADMHAQADRREERLSARPSLHLVEAPARTGVVAVVAGAGNEAQFREAGAERIVHGGQTMNPSTRDLLEAIEAVRADAVLVLPNNGNVILAAERACEQARAEGREARVVSTRSIAAGLTAIVGFDADAGLDQNVERLEELLAGVRTGELTRAVRRATLDGRAVAEGDFMGLAEGALVAAGRDAEGVARELVEHLAAGGGDVLTLIRGQQEAFDVGAFAERLAGEHPELEVVLLDGGQPLYPLLLALE